MLAKDLFRGKLVRLTLDDFDTISKQFSRWHRDSLYWRLMDSWPATVHSPKSVKDWLEGELLDEPSTMNFFTIHALEDDRFIGDINLSNPRCGHGEAFVGIAIGERDYWGKGYGTDAMQVILRFGFAELNLHRITLDVFEYNPRAIRSYEKAGFRHEGRQRGAMLRDGRRWDMIHMGILRSEWEALQA